MNNLRKLKFFTLSAKLRVTFPSRKRLFCVGESVANPSLFISSYLLDFYFWCWEFSQTFGIRYTAAACRLGRSFKPSLLCRASAYDRPGMVGLIRRRAASQISVSDSSHPLSVSLVSVMNQISQGFTIYNDWWWFLQVAFDSTWIELGVWVCFFFSIPQRNGKAPCWAQALI